MKSTFQLLAGISFLLLSGCLEIGDQDYVAVVGVGEARQAPDYASMIIGVERRAKTAAEASALLNAEVGKLMKVAEEFGLSDEEIKSSYLLIDRYTEYVVKPDGSRINEPAGFQAEQMITFRTKDVYRAGELLSNLIIAGGETSSNPVYLIDDEAALFERARDLAIEDAKRRAMQYAEASGKSLGEVLIVEESGTKAERLKFDLQDKLSEKYRQEGSGAAADRPSPAYGAPYNQRAIYTKPQEIALTVSIYAKFKLE